MHLRLLGNPIANDPCYGGALFYADESRRNKAVGLLRMMKELGHIPLSKVPHIDIPELDSANCPNTSLETDCCLASVSSGTSTAEIKVQDALTANCRYCKEYRISSELETMLHCDGIWLHALKYKGEGWTFASEPPSWATGTFRLVNFADIGSSS